MITPSRQAQVLYVSRVGERSVDRAIGWRPRLPGVHEVFHAHFVEHRYPPHVHDTWTILLVDVGAVRYDLEHRHRGSDTTAVTILPPHIVHDGRSATPSGFTKRVLYVDTSVLPEAFIGAAVDRPAINDDRLIADLSRLHRHLVDADDLLAGEEVFDRVTERIQRWLTLVAPAPARSDPGAAARLREVLDEHLFEPVTLADVTKALGLSVGHASRAFARTFGVTPHAYVVARRVDRARRLLLDGASVADVAVAAGFHDQAHLTRHFRRHTGTTPGCFAQGTRPRRRQTSATYEAAATLAGWDRASLEEGS